MTIIILVKEVTLQLGHTLKDGSVKVLEESKSYVSDIVSAAKAYDVLQYNSTITLTVTGPDGVAIFNNADISEDVELTFDKYGVYSVTYSAIDNVGKKTVYVFNFCFAEVIYSAAVKKTFKVPRVVAVISKSFQSSSASTTPSQAKFEKHISDTISSISGLIEIFNSK